MQSLGDEQLLQSNFSQWHKSTWNADHCSYAKDSGVGQRRLHIPNQDKWQYMRIVFLDYKQKKVNELAPTELRRKD